MATAAGTVSALTAYRQVLRAARIAFQGDVPVLNAARVEARKQFDENRRFGIDTPMKINHAIETAQILKTNVVQGVKTESANENGEPVDRYSLRIHEHIERGDNDTIKGPGDKPVKVDKPCS